ncbi:probable U3 small nucleolar RNA-associated protein 11 [Tetranychus urticae]|uniref:U3 small nucleolar RNA-associated protein 11 n=1 Tax=Tetranychus urticae TaxID=32264 RepID=T1K5V5_TETUR|nr:probable U3 small nucleolar RNA-associated protein 11 [Tetranychus urticae]
MGSLAKTNKAFQRLHRERHQPDSRKKFGFLEKKKDYKTRALDHQKKVNTIKLLKEKVANKNPNEFYFHMMNSQLVDGKHFEKRKDTENVKEIEDKNIKFLNWRRGIELKKIEKLQSQLHFIDVDDKPANKRIIFKEEGPKRKLKAIEVKPGESSKPSQSNDSPKLDQLPINLPSKVNKKMLAKLAKDKNKAYTRLMNEIEKEKLLRNLIEKRDFKLQKPRKSKMDKFNEID